MSASLFAIFSNSSAFIANNTFNTSNVLVKLLIYVSVGIVNVPCDPLLEVELSIVVVPVLWSCVTVALGLIFLPPTFGGAVDGLFQLPSCLLFNWSGVIERLGVTDSGCTVLYLDPGLSCPVSTSDGFVCMNFGIFLPYLSLPSSVYCGSMPSALQRSSHVISHDEPHDSGPGANSSAAPLAAPLAVPAAPLAAPAAAPPILDATIPINGNIFSTSSKSASSSISSSSFGLIALSSLT